jgi:hypothetical protein
MHLQEQSLIEIEKKIELKLKSKEEDIERIK